MMAFFFATDLRILRIKISQNYYLSMFSYCKIFKLVSSACSILMGCSVFICCSSGPAEKKITEAEKKDPVAVIEKPTEIIPVTPKPFFDVAFFAKQADSLISFATGQKLHFEYKVQRLDIKHNPDLFTSEKDTVKMYSFDAGKGNRIYNFRIREGNYTSEAEALKALNALRTAAHNSPAGLTYTNDNVFALENKVIWLNTGCSYAYGNHIKMKNILLRTLQYSTITDSIVCRCGGDCNQIQQ
ncbi:MAG: hypothetical protein JWO44_594 [Bacteroidetes bacterium]|nr:hypothetical protein [Bacteroidota bacterium]